MTTGGHRDYILPHCAGLRPDHLGRPTASRATSAARQSRLCAGVLARSAKRHQHRPERARERGGLGRTRHSRSASTTREDQVEATLGAAPRCRLCWPSGGRRVHKYTFIHRRAADIQERRRPKRRRSRHSSRCSAHAPSHRRGGRPSASTRRSSAGITPSKSE
jgi:hypothetical protein